LTPDKKVNPQVKLVIDGEDSRTNNNITRIETHSNRLRATLSEGFQFGPDTKLTLSQTLNFVNSKTEGQDARQQYEIGAGVRLDQNIGKDTKFFIEGNVGRIQRIDGGIAPGTPSTTVGLNASAGISQKITPGISAEVSGFVSNGPGTDLFSTGLSGPTGSSGGGRVQVKYSW
jgi:hypothetical protein